MSEVEQLAILEYHGWTVLCCRDAGWTDDEWGYARASVEVAVEALREEAGHAVHVNWPANGGSVVALNGWTADAEPALALFRRVAEVAPHSYGELSLFPDGDPDSRLAVRYRMREGSIQLRQAHHS